MSGGQRQRHRHRPRPGAGPDVLLLDEPFAAVDAQIRQELRQWLVRLHQDLKITAIFVTHDQEEAMEVADRIVVFSKGAWNRSAPRGKFMRSRATSSWPASWAS